MSVSSRFVRSCACLLALFAATALVACGSSSDDDPQQLSFEVQSKGKAVTISAPDSAEAGLAEITLTNDTDTSADLQLIRVEGERSAKEVVEGLGKAIQGQSFPEWLFTAGGVGSLEPGKSATVTQVLQPGSYYAFNTEGGPPSPDATAVTKVSGEESDEELAEAETTVEAVEYAFNADTLPAGQVEIAFDNTGAEQPHHLIASKFIDDKATAEDVEKFFKTEKGKPPISEKGTRSTAVLEGGEAQLVTLDLEPGRYALYCFITDREGGPPHAFKGMIDEVEVE